ncbi:MAG: hypothetical protein IPP83_11275 [Flavobacteriales bacterium]|nr:hypothetical protein [Flavobacteriales bacterium]
MRSSIPFILLFMIASPAFAQNIAINADGAAPNTSALLDVDATALPALAKKGLLVPRIALGATNVAAPVVAPATSLLVYNTATAGVAPNNVSPGYYYWNGAVWIRFASTGDGWLITGNAGTVAGTNFIGTTDAVDWMIKTGGALAANERMRVRSTGQVVQNNTAHFAGDVFSVYGNTTTNGATPSINNAVGTFSVNGYASGSGTGVYGETAGGATTNGTAVWGDIYGTATTASSTSEGVWGTNSTAPAGTGLTASVASGVRGDATGAAGTAFTMGVLGTNTGTTGSAFGVYGQNTSSTASGVFGVNLNTGAVGARGVEGQAAGTAGGIGSIGFFTGATIGAGQSGYGVRGVNNVAPTGTGFAIGVRGDVGGVSGATYGVYGQAASATGFGMDGVNTNVNGTAMILTGNNAGGTYLVAGSGAAINANGVGTFSIAKTAASGIGIIAIGNNLTGSIIAPARGCGVSGVGTQYGVMGFATTTVNTIETNNSAFNGAAASAGGYFEVQAAAVAQTWAYVGVRDGGGVNRKIIGPGTVNTIVHDLKGNRVALSCPEAPENLFQDYGSGHLINGRVQVMLDPILSKNIVVNEAHPLRVFVQLEGECNGVYVTNKSTNGFEVIELGSGTSNVSFSYTVVANRADEVNPDGTIAHYSAERFPAAPGPQAKVLLETRADDTAVRSEMRDAPTAIAALPTKKIKRSR